MAANCPICGKPTADAYKPFCSKRCADVDLHRWFTEGYTTPAIELDDVDEADLAKLDPDQI